MLPSKQIVLLVLIHVPANKVVGTPLLPGLCKRKYTNEDEPNRGNASRMDCTVCFTWSQRPCCDRTSLSMRSSSAAWHPCLLHLPPSFSDPTNTWAGPASPTQPSSAPIDQHKDCLPPRDKSMSSTPWKACKMTCKLHGRCQILLERTSYSSLQGGERASDASNDLSRL